MSTDITADGYAHINLQPFVHDGQVFVGVSGCPDSFGATTVVGKLVFVSNIYGQIIALDRATGTEVWRHQADGGINGWPAVAGDLIVLPIGCPAAEDDGVPHLLALRLDGVSGAAAAG